MNGRKAKELRRLAEKISVEDTSYNPRRFREVEVAKGEKALKEIPRTMKVSCFRYVYKVAKTATKQIG